MKYSRGKKVAEPITKPIIVNVYTADGEVSEITTGGFLGNIALEDGKGTGVFRGKSYPVSVDVRGFGTVPPQMEYRGNRTVESDRIVNALDSIDYDREEKLSEEEKTRLKAISTKELHQVVVDALTAEPRVWTPFIDACQDADQELELPEYHEEPIYVEVEGHKAVGCDVRVDVNGARFLFGEASFAHCSDGRELYQFSAQAAVGIFPDGEVYYPAEQE